MTKFNKDHAKAQWLKIIDHFGEDAINAQLWHSTFAETRKYFENRMPMSTEPPSDNQHCAKPNRK